MQQDVRSLRPFIGARDYALCRRFYSDLGFEEVVLSEHMSVFKRQELAFYLQNAYVKDWIDNTMVFLEVEDMDGFYQELTARDLPAKYPGVKLTPIRNEAWGRECHLLDPSGVLWHFGIFH